ncbi:CRISPR-associated endonuclease Cas3'' [Halococcus sp. IIIV-5B]|uniref:CRISPR-associated endonuclease Cas3'' n=1 Tax=Halococcus sp. IIIV-5B TaxID=2321230 RepID=UPI000E7587AE|nr:CRISPR-associated endonuclease Cas3'' [Halococcus sp. IIIV-5B]RJT07549.1 CRISPR-associated endonuclease Cas3'' [Halococcus sp. IIIV-5B]
MALDPNERYSHPPEGDQPPVKLVSHLEDVAGRIDHLVSTDATTPSGESLHEIVRRLALVHDLGKATEWFQQYIDDDRRNPRQEEKRHHSPLGSFAAFAVLERGGFEAETCIAGFVAVAKHHGQLPHMLKYVAGRTEGSLKGDDKSLDLVAHQAKNIHDEAQAVARTVFEKATGDGDNWTAFAQSLVDDSLVERIADHVVLDEQPNVDALSESCYSLVLQCWSSLVLADKTSAAGADKGPETYAAESPSTDRLNEYIADIEDGASANPDGTRAEQLNYHRSRARTSVLNNTEVFANEDSNVATLTLPTGMGKTLTGLSAAFDLRDRLGGERVVYALPFTSIIDQVVDEIETIYDTNTAGRLLTAHHHLAETVIQEKDDEEADLDDNVGAMLAEAWRSGLTVTTFVQFFESLAGPRNTQSMKLPALRDSVVVLDEPQSLPLDWWKLVPRLVEILTEQYDVTVIAMTATQPELFDGAYELVDDPSSYFGVERVQYELDTSAERYIDDQTDPKSYDGAADALRDSLESNESALAVCNTIDSARELTERVTEFTGVDIGDIYADELAAVGDVDSVDPGVLVGRVVERGNDALLHLSTRLRPADRLTLIETAKRLTQRGYPLVTVSTQLIEAGVDISFDRVYRDLAPMDSIVQSAGRCNRSFESDRGRVTVWWLDSPGNQVKTPAEAVYNRGVSLLPVAASTLDAVRADDGSLSETDVARTAVERYYERLHEEKDVGKQTYANYVDNARADELGRLSLIDQRHAADVLVCRTDVERKLAEQVREANHTYEFEELRRLLNKTKPLRVSVPYYREDSQTADAIGDLPVIIEENGLYELDARQYASHFDGTTGFVVPENTVDHLFL